MEPQYRDTALALASHSVGTWIDSLIGTGLALDYHLAVTWLVQGLDKMLEEARCSTHCHLLSTSSVPVWH